MFLIIIMQVIKHSVYLNDTAKKIASEIYDNIMNIYAPLFVAFESKMQSLIEPTLFD